MRTEEARFVWLMVLFDLPVGTKPERRDATRFRNFLKDDGYLMLQYSSMPGYAGRTKPRRSM